jgi:tetrapyrrole methylase family protein / MazG family protein
MQSMLDYNSDIIFNRPCRTDEAFERFMSILRVLRGENGCPWDLKQTVHTMKSYLLEETYEALDAIETGDSEAVKEELGDVALLVFMLAYIEEQDNKYTVVDVLNGISDKLVRRHPHVFGEDAGTAIDSQQVKHTWDIIKKAEKASRMNFEESDGNISAKSGSSETVPSWSILADIPKNAPVTDQAYQIQKKVSKAGFDWDNPLQVLDKIQEELNELREELTRKSKDKTDYITAGQNERNPESSLKSDPFVLEELGDLIFSVINAARKIGIHPDLALRKTVTKFVDRFVQIENAFKETAKKMSPENRDEMEAIWNLHRYKGRRPKKAD